MPVWQPAYIGLGSNLHQPREQVERAFTELARLPHSTALVRSRYFLSQPLGRLDQPHFVNAAAGLLTQLSAPQVLQALRAIETAFGRPERHERWGPRVIDLDLLSFAHERRTTPELTLPHPGIPERNFVLYPLADIAPDLELPGLGRVAELKERIGSAGINVLDSDGERDRS